MLTPTEKQLRDIVHATANELEILCRGGHTDNYDDVYDWLNDQLGIEEYTFSHDGSFLDAKISVCLGGPNVFVYPGACRVDGCWANDSYSIKYNLDIYDEDELFNIVAENARYAVSQEW